MGFKMPPARSGGGVFSCRRSNLPGRTHDFYGACPVSDFDLTLYL